MIELAVKKQGVLAGTYYNEATGISRPLKGMLDQESQRAAVAFADGKNADLILETGINNLTQDECPALLHFGASQSSPVLLVRLQPPAEPAGGQYDFNEAWPSGIAAGATKNRLAQSERARRYSAGHKGRRSIQIFTRSGPRFTCSPQRASRWTRMEP